MLDGLVGLLDVVVDLLDVDVVVQFVVVIVCYLLFIEGGSMYNKVVMMVVCVLCDFGIVMVCFNFCSVGQLVGEFDYGNGEQDDFKVVVVWVCVQQLQVMLWLVGFSFGVFVLLCVVGDLQLVVLVFIVLFVGCWDFEGVQLLLQWLVIQGDEDEIVDLQVVYIWLEGIGVLYELVCMFDISYFFYCKLIDLCGVIIYGVKYWLFNVDVVMV